MAVNQKRVTSSRFPYLPLRFQIRQYTHEGEALIDSGFDGGIVVPPSLLENVGLPTATNSGGFRSGVQFVPLSIVAPFR
jgi:predicted aspartyl protease